MVLKLNDVFASGVLQRIKRTISKLILGYYFKETSVDDLIYNLTIRKIDQI